MRLTLVPYPDIPNTVDAVEVKDEHFIDMATAVSGTGPAYVFLTM